MQLIEQTCQLRVEEYLNNDYKTVGFYPEEGLNFPCTHLELRQGVLQTSYQFSFLKIDSAEKVEPRETILNIDDLGIIRLIALRSIQDSLPSEEEWISSFRSPKPYIYSRSTIEV